VHMDWLNVMAGGFDDRYSFVKSYTMRCNYDGVEQ
jgi:hypothetical protein